jgi:hypothetical protein
LKGTQETSYANFLEYIGQQLQGLQTHQARIATQNFDGIMDLIQLFRDHRINSRADIMDILKSSFPNVEETAISRSAELALRLWLSINVQSSTTTVGHVQADDTAVEWLPDQSLDGLSQFQKSSPTLPHNPKGGHIDRDLTATYLLNVCDIQLDWTNNLVDHLRLDRKRRVLTIYRHKVCLFIHAKSSRTVLPLDLVQETIDTLNLLFPISDGPTKALLLRDGQPFFELGNCGRDLNLDLGHYNYWRDRLIVIMEVFNEPPRQWKQLMCDRRNKMNFATFWIAVLVLVLTIVSIAFGTMSTVYTIKQYNLARAQACLMVDAKNLLPLYCG